MASPTPKTFRVSDESINSYNLRVLTSGIETTAFESNPVMLFMHRRGKVFGEWANLTMKDGQLFAEPKCDAGSTNDEVTEIAGQVARGVIKAASIGITFKMEDVVFNEALQCYDVLKCTLIEISIVDIPSNANAICMYNQNGEVLTELQLSAQLSQIKPADLPPTTTQKTTMSQFKTLALAAGLGEEATESQIQTAILSLHANAGYKAKYDELINDQKAKQASLAADLVDAAVKDGRVPATMKDNYLKLMGADFEGTSAILASLATPVNLTNFAKGIAGAAGVGAAGGSTSTAALLTLSNEEAVKEWDARDKSNMLLNLQTENPEAYKHLFKAKFKKEPATK